MSNTFAVAAIREFARNQQPGQNGQRASLALTLAIDKKKLTNH